MNRVVVLEATSPEAERWVREQPGTGEPQLSSMDAYSHLWLFAAPPDLRSAEVKDLHPGVKLYGPDTAVGLWAAEEYSKLQASSPEQEEN